ncbi:MAG: alkyl sulfatase BDS1-like metallo-beta-lactamase superfamily hydrolase, partial [Gammaproteobacteria bacterium]
MTENRGKFTREAAQAYLAKEPEMQVEKLADRIWTICDGTCRTVFLEADNSVIAFDTFGTPGRARAYKKAVSTAIPDKAIKTIIYTHDHLD